jgi:uncharacterized protein (TIGR02453 family)
MTTFDGFGPGVHAWFKGLEADNTKAYFSANRDFFESSIRDQMEALLTELSGEFGGQVKLFRQNRDVRFSPDKSPYKTNTYGIVHGAASAPMGMYASISTHGLVAGSGYHAMARDQLERFRAAVAEARTGLELESLAGAAEAAGLDLWGECVATAPRGYPKDHPRIALLRRKALALGATFAAGSGVGREEALRFVAATWRAAAPVTRWLDAHVGASTMPGDGGGRRR